MTDRELHKILDDEKRKISIQELQQIIYELKQDAFDEMCKNIPLEVMRYYAGEVNAFYIALDLIEHLETEKNNDNKRN